MTRRNLFGMAAKELSCAPSWPLKAPAAPTSKGMGSIERGRLFACAGAASNHVALAIDDLQVCAERLPCAPVRPQRPHRSSAAIHPTVRVQIRRAAITVALALAVVGCGRETDPRLSPDDPAVQAYGYGPIPNRNITYQPDVMIIGGGPKAIRSVSADGLTWVIDGKARNAKALKVGDVMFATSRAVGRVFEIEPQGSDLAVTVLPIGLGEIIRNGTIDIDTTISPAEALTSTWSLPAGARRSSWIEGPAHGLRSAVWYPELDEVELLPVGQTRKDSAKLRIGDFEIEPYFKFNGAVQQTGDIAPDYAAPAPADRGRDQGASDPSLQVVDSGDTQLGIKVMRSQGRGLKYGADFRLTGKSLKIRSHLPFIDGKLGDDSSLVLDGIDRIDIGLFGGAEHGATDNVKIRLEVPAEMTVPIPPTVTDGVPLALHLKFKLIVDTAFSGANSTLWSRGVYKVVGPMGFDHGKALVPKLEVRKPMIDMMGVTVGASGIVTAVEFRFLPGVGTAAAMAGPYGKLTVSAGLSRGSVMGLVADCKGVALKADVAAGLGVLVDLDFKDYLKHFEQSSRWQQLAKVRKTEAELFETTGSIIDRKYVVPNVPICNR
jgi:hypothetical protein